MLTPKMPGRLHALTEHENLFSSLSILDSDMSLKREHPPLLGHLQRGFTFQTAGFVIKKSYLSMMLETCWSSL